MALATFKDIQDEVLNFGFNDGPGVNRPRVKNWINEAQHRIAREVDAQEFQKKTTVTTAANTATVSLPADFLRARTVYLANYTSRLRPVDIDQFDTNPTGITGPPSAYTFSEASMYLYPTPDQAYSLQLRYIANPAELVNDGDVPTLAANYLDLLVTYAVYRAFTAEDDYEAAQFFNSQWQKDLASYATDVQFQHVDRPRVIDGTWTGTPYGGG